ncbi:SurA N-terminal domain-containing protein [Roseovarius sp. 2305UL8-3]|uniref:SurA N-terminal domain-containing protein n=1 Tax=Roseovarius conchicola TaxID=3121636 RepID=UPI003527625A
MAGKSTISKTAVWILMGLLILGLGGFGVTNLSGNVRSVGSVGETQIDVRDYARALRNEINAEASARQAPVSFFMAQDLGLDDRVLSQLISTAALEEETRLMGVSIGDESLRDQILEIPAFRGLDGEFDREAYRQTLQQSNMNEAEFEQDMRAEAARTLLQGAVLAGVNVPDSYTDTMMRFIGERRTITFATLDRDALTTGLPVADEADLVAYHEANLPDFTTPEVKQITYVWLTPEMIIDTVEVDEASLREAYEDQEDEYNQPERRLVERLGFADVLAADTALAQLEAGEITFEALIEARGLSLTDADMGDVSITDLGEAGPSVFAAEAGDVVGPLSTPIGPALFRVNGILEAQNVTFEEAEPQLRDELAGDRARRALDAEIDGIADLLAGGATLEDVAKETDLVMGTIDWHPGMTDGIAAYDAFRAAAEAITEDDFPDIEKLDDDGLFALRLEQIIAPEVQPLDTVRAEVEAGWREQAIADALRAQIEPQLAGLNAGGDFAEAGLEQPTTLEVTRSTFQPDAPPEFIDTVFGLEDNAVEILDGEGRIFVMRLDSVAPPDLQNEDMVRLRRALSEDAASSLAQDMFILLASDIRTRLGVELDQPALNAVHSNFQ